MSSEILIFVLVGIAVICLLLAFKIIKYGLIGGGILFAWAGERADFLGVMIMLLFFILFFPVMAVVSVIVGITGIKAGGSPSLFAVNPKDVWCEQCKYNDPAYDVDEYCANCDGSSNFEEKWQL